LFVQPKARGRRLNERNPGKCADDPSIPRVRWPWSGVGSRTRVPLGRKGFEAVELGLIPGCLVSKRGGSPEQKQRT
jgi:hypothetical protein